MLTTIITLILIIKKTQGNQELSNYLSNTNYLPIKKSLTTYYNLQIINVEISYLEDILNLSYEFDNTKNTYKQSKAYIGLKLLQSRLSKLNQMQKTFQNKNKITCKIDNLSKYILHIKEIIKIHSRKKRDIVKQKKPKIKRQINNSPNTGNKKFTKFKKDLTKILATPILNQNYINSLYLDLTDNLCSRTPLPTYLFIVYINKEFNLQYDTTTISTFNKDYMLNMINKYFKEYLTYPPTRSNCRIDRTSQTPKKQQTGHECRTLLHTHHY